MIKAVLKNTNHLEIIIIPSQIVAMCTVIKIILCVYILSSIVTCLEVGSQCKTKKDEDGICKHYSDCPNIVNQLKSRQIEYNDIFKCSSYGVICCPSEILELNIKIKGDISKRSKITFFLTLL